MKTTLLFLLSLTLAAQTQTTVNGRKAYSGAVNAQTSTYQALVSDFNAPCGTIPVASGTFTIMLVASGTQPVAGQCLDIINYGSGVVTVARSGQNINGGTASLTLAAGSASAPTGVHIVSDGTNYEAQTWAAGEAAGVILNPFIAPITAVVTGNWSNFGASCARSTVTGPNSGGALHIVSTTGSANICGYSHSVSAGDFSYDFIFSAAIPEPNSSSFYPTVAIGFTDGTKVEGVETLWNVGANIYGVTNTTGTATALTSGSYAAANGTLQDYSGNFNFIVARLTRIGTALAGYFSFDGGITFTQMFNDTSPFLTASSIAFWTDPRGGTKSIGTLISSTLQ